jgi:hypothetical protein
MGNVMRFPFLLFVQQRIILPALILEYIANFHAKPIST